MAGRRPAGIGRAHDVSRASGGLRRVASAPDATDQGPAPERWVSTDAELNSVVDELLVQDAYAIDTEFLRERTYYPHLALVQIAWPGGLVLIDPLATPMTPLARLFNSDVLAVFHAADQDLEVLDYACGSIPRRMFDTQLAAGFLGFSTPSLLSLAERVLGARLSKGDRLTDWTQRPLTSAQRSYAASDVHHLLELRDLMMTELVAVGRMGWVEEEFEVLRTRTRGPQDPGRAWWRLKDGRVLRGADRMVGQELCAWRERKARLEDKPVRFVLPDLAVLAIAQARPSSPAALGAVRGIDGRYTKGSGATEILAAVERASAMTPAELQLPETEEFDRRLRPALTLISAWIAQLARDARIDTAMLATRSDLVQFLRGDDDARLRAGWRAQVVGENVQRLVSGSAALAFEPTGTLSLELRSHEAVAMDLVVPAVTWAEQPDLD